MMGPGFAIAVSDLKKVDIHVVMYKSRWRNSHICHWLDMALVLLNEFTYTLYTERQCEFYCMN